MPTTRSGNKGREAKQKSSKIDNNIKKSEIKESSKRKRNDKVAKLETKNPKLKENKYVSYPSHEHSKEAKILEKGHIYFFYRPKVDHSEVHNIDDVQKLYILLSPLEETKKKRLMIMVRKQLPEASKHSKYWAFVLKASKDIEDIDSMIAEEHYETKTKGERIVAGARPIAEGFYSIVKHQKGHTHLVYILELPSNLGNVQKAFHLHEEGSFIISVKNPERSRKGSGFQGLNKKAKFPEHLQDIFHGLSWSPVDPTEFLEYENSEILFIGASDNLIEEFGKTGEIIEKEEKEDVKKITKDSLFKELQLSKKEHPPEPLFNGRWK